MWRDAMLRQIRIFVMLILAFLSAQTCRSQSYCNERLTLAGQLSSPSVTPQALNNITTQAVADDILKQVNSARHMYDAPDLTWNVTMAALAEKDAASCGSSTGTDLSADLCYEASSDASWQRCIDDWFSESLRFDFAHPTKWRKVEWLR